METDVGGNRLKWALEVAGSAVRHPSAVCRAVNGYNIRTFFRMTRENGLGVAVRNAFRLMSNCSFDYTGDGQSGEIPPAGGCPDSVPFSENPLVSIIIPVYNQYAYTAACLGSVAAAAEGTDVEIIVADDNSSDETAELEKHVAGLTVIHNRTNFGFLLNCNNAAKHAKGKYLLFLNNDTLVGKDWLRSMTDLAESDGSIGLVGSKFIYPDGSLQEAGGILWSDGSAWNYGRGDDPDRPEYNYLKDADYISGASIMVLRSLFEEIGGFDERFVPAYCEDSDLAFTVRKMGYRTVYQPRSEVMHFEGISNGKTVQSRMKSYQIVNTEKFREKWKEVLSSHNPRGEDVFHARDRTSGRKTVLFVVPTVPRFDDNAGDRTVYDYVRTLVSMGYNVKMLPESFYYDPIYTPVYEAMGVEVLYGRGSPYDWKHWIRINSENIDYVMMFRPQCAEYFMKFIRKNTSAVIIYNVADLHYIRLRREYEVTGNLRCLKESERYRRAESKYLGMADRCVTVSTAEAEEMARTVDRSKIRIYPIFCYDRCGNEEKSYAAGNRILFVGSFNHPPNRDAMYWFFGSILPRIAEEIPDVRMDVVGSNAPDDLRETAPDCVVFHDHIPDGELETLYSEASVCVIPLRFGAGVKGKTLEAMRNSVPIVSTSVGIEGMPGIGDYVVPADDAESFAAETVRIMNDPEYAGRIGRSYRIFVSENYSCKKMRELFSQEF